MALNVLLVLFMLSISLGSNCVLGKMNISMEEDMEFERQLKILNKPPIKTIQDEDGNIFDCVDINKQPALDHPLLQDHKVQAKPCSSFPSIMENPSSVINGTSFQTLSTTKICPFGTVPVQRTRKEHLVRARFLRETLKKADISRQKEVSLGMKPKFRIYGAGGQISVYNLKLASDQLSTANIWVSSGPSTRENFIAAGWMVSPALYGDNRARLFTFWTADGNRKTGCFNTLCQGFVQVDRGLTPAAILSPVSTYGGKQFYINVEVFQDRKTGNWWLFASNGNKNIAVGYWPKKLFPLMSIGCERVSWGGVAQTGKNGISPPMGNGHFPDGNFRHACSFLDIRYVDHKNTLIPPNNGVLFQQIDKPKCYGLKNAGFISQQNGYSFTFGGPGGKCG